MLTLTVDPNESNVIVKRTIKKKKKNTSISVVGYKKPIKIRTEQRFPDGFL